MKKFLVFLCAILLVFAFAGSSAAFYMDFEEGLGGDGTQIIGVPGVTFTSSGGQTWTYGDINTGGYNVTSVDTGDTYGTGRYNMYGDVFAWLGTSGDWGRIDFDDENGTWFQVGVSAANYFYLEAYADDGTLLDSATTGVPACTTWEGYTDMVFLRVDAPENFNISYVIVHDSGNYWGVDNMSGDMEGGYPVPEPATMLLLGSGLIGLAFLGRKKLFKR